jgi:hypothetical protein
VRTRLGLAVSLCAGLLAFSPTAASHLIAGPPKGKPAAKVAKRNLAHARGACAVYRKIRQARSHRSHCRAIPWLERVARRHSNAGASSAAMRWWHTSGARCVKNHEGAWTSNTGNGYYGGFQADLSFQQAYGAEFYRRWGTANNWPVWAQITMAYRGWHRRGWHPWPNTARACGLL